MLRMEKVEGTKLAVITLAARDSLLIRAGNLFSGKEDFCQRNVLLLIAGGLIKKILPAAGGEEAAGIIKRMGLAGRTSFLDLANLTILPGMVDCHVHLALDGVDFQKAKGQWVAPGKVAGRVGRRLAATLTRGVLAVRDGGDRAGIGLLGKAKVRSGNLPGPYLTATGSALRKSGMYGSFLGAGVDGDLGGALDRLVAAGVDQIKVLVSGIVSFTEYGRVGPPQFSPEELAFLVARAHRAGLKVMAHASSDLAVVSSARAGVDSIEHGYFMSRATLRMLAELGISWVPTVVPVAGQAGRSDLFTREQLGVIEKTYRNQLETIAEAARLGVAVGVGTDAGSPGVRHGEGFLRELALYRQAGLAPAVILKAATVAGAKIAGVEQEVGPLEEGRPANMIAVEGNPLADLAALENVKYIILRGRDCGAGKL
ncbi:MAG: amidohydrolase family protein [Bacillota bacterium]